MFDPPPAERVCVLIGYKHKVELDQSVVDHVVRALDPHHAIFIDKKILQSSATFEPPPPRAVQLRVAHSAGPPPPYMLKGNPYLTRRALYTVATGRAGVADIFAKATDDRGPFGGHMRHHLFRGHDNDDLAGGLCEVMRRNTCVDETIFFRLRTAGRCKEPARRRK
jgi:AAA domain-containing protein